MTSLKAFFKQMFSKERRKAERQPAQKLAAYYWTGAAPTEHLVRDISSTGLFLLTEERWYPGTLVKMTLQKRNDEVDYTERAISVQSRAVRWGEDGVGLEFIVPDSRNRGHGQNLLEESIDRKGLEKFLAHFSAESGRAVVTQVETPSSALLNANIIKS